MRTATVDCQHGYRLTQAVAANRAEISAVRAAYSWSMDQMYRALLDKQKFAWQLLCEPPEPAHSDSPLPPTSCSITF